ncbi:TIGR02679 family protein, partial [Patulibacter sp. NPDC049589]|uniref:TIGR02679 family protein n=1 Tax=Patulibacter sp. NPDC049589 TaxID=3154731 RepID=UPI00344375C4
FHTAALTPSSPTRRTPAGRGRAGGRRGGGRAAADAAEWAALERHRAFRRHPGLRGWLAREQSTGLARRVAGGPPFVLLASALEAVAALPADPPVTLARFAAGLRLGPASASGDPHALDRGTPLDGTVRRALAWLDDDGDAPGGAEARRDRYDRWGVICDELSSTVLCAGLRPPGASPLEAGLRAAAEAGEPRVLTLRELRGRDVLVIGPTVFVCENPDVVAAAADELGASCPPLVCTEGWPSAAVLRLLRAVVAGGASARHHGDMDADGLRIVAHLLAVTGGTAWRMSAADHAAHRDQGAPVDRLPSDDVPPSLSGVARAIRESRRAVREEQTIRTLLWDLDGTS